ncbi:unnamed protein product [Cuscuta europaea]|uniref:RING-type domain-containing protein n=1 Tax=Cuscuta europaea TaxID=41803 RepID=A0A9P0ZRL1_CUSEU|nr:unnamed protein product [Cuscuta europaea]
MAATFTIRSMRAFPHPDPAANVIGFRLLVNETPPGVAAVVRTVRDNRVKVPFHPGNDMSSWGSAFSFIASNLEEHFGLEFWDSFQLANYMVPFALSNVRDRPCGLILSNVIEATFTTPSQPPPPQDALFLDDTLVFNAGDVSQFAAAPAPFLPAGWSSGIETTYAPRLQHQDALFVDGGLVFNSFADDPYFLAAVSPPLPAEGMSENEISSIKTEAFGSGKGEACSICLDDFRAGSAVISLSPCSHKFHKGCIAKWLRRRRTCPMCRTVALVS